MAAQRIQMGGKNMTTEEESLALKNIGLSQCDISEVLTCAGKDAKIRLLRKHRFRILEGIHKEQKSLDSLDYFIYQLKSKP